MNILELLKGKTVNVTTDARVAVKLVIESVKEVAHSEALEESTAANDWWPASRDWKTFEVKFTNGHTKSYESVSLIDIVEP